MDINVKVAEADTEMAAETQQQNETAEDQENDSSKSHILWTCIFCKNPSSCRPTIEPCQCSQTNGLVHPSCLISWMNTYYKGRCPRCSFLFRIKTAELPRNLWEADPMLKLQKTKYIVMVTLNLMVTVVCFVSASHLLHAQTDEKTAARVAVAVAITAVYVFYFVYQSRLYVRIYERLSIYNNKVVEVFDRWDLRDERSVTVRKHNLSSYIDNSEF